MSSYPQIYRLPDLIPVCPFGSDLPNPHADKAGKESKDWILTYDFFTDRRKALVHSGVELLAAHVYPYANFTNFRMACDFINTEFVLDDMIDDQDRSGVSEIGKVWMRAFLDESWDDGSKIARFSKDFRTRFMAVASPVCFKRLSNSFQQAFEASVKETEFREQDIVLDLESFTRLRRANSAVYPCLNLIEPLLEIEIPDGVFDDPAFSSLYHTACDLVWIANDIYSYNFEQSRAHHHFNLITVLMEDKLDLQGAMDLAGTHFHQRIIEFLSTKDRMPSWGSTTDVAVERYIKGLEDWVIGNIHFSFASKRYFGENHLNIKKTLEVELLPRISLPNAKGQQNA